MALKEYCFYLLLLFSILLPNLYRNFLKDKPFQYLASKKEVYAYLNIIVVFY